MVVNADGVPVPTRRPGPARAGTRRELLRGLLGVAAGLALVPVVAAAWPPGPADDTVGAGFDEMYRGRRIQGVLTPVGRSADGAQWEVTVDGRPLHLMRRADGTWLSMIDHYRSYRTPLEAARAAVDELGPGEGLRESDDPADGGHLHDMGGRRGLHA
ncbi:tyrosinase cofactor [Streptomyces sp. NBC_00582]|uniref:tyrosinase cofactor n=1 Tax=Streptomyces sp. NBC_00582 TaxID=2975783 RepID=UPI001062E8CC|nr:tyrosinase cofactor [Streptomyces sp. NBC_00582]WUB64581.1 tyrosinase cofactor [Streptomyces sp. NBC_00582]